MPAHVIDLRNTDDSRDVVHRAVQALAEGKVVAFPTETVYTLAASALSAEGVKELRRLREAAGGSKGGATDLFVLAVKSADEALDYVPDMSRLGQRLSRRCWPGPVTLLVPDNHPESLLMQMAPEVQQAVAPGGMLSLRVPAHQFIQDVMRLLAGPIVITNAPRRDQADAVTAQEVIEVLNDDLRLIIDEGRSRFGQPSSVVQVNDSSFDVLRVGVVSEQTLKRLASAMIIFVCTGNTCRSPMAEVLFRHRLAKKLKCKPEELEDRGWVVTSAGTSAAMGNRPSHEAVNVMAEQGIDLHRHESQPLTEQLARHADLLVVMTRGHREAVISAWPDVAARTKLLSQDGLDISDPIGGPVELYRRCAAQIDAELDRWIQEIAP